jgi:hypothetical protein
MSKISNIPGEEDPKSVKTENLLPAVFRTDINKKMLDSSLNLMTSKGKMQPFYESYGTQNASDVNGKFLETDPSEVRKESQTNLAINYYDADLEYKGKFSYVDLENYFKIQGLPLKDGVDLDQEVKSLQLPLSQQRLTDYQLYYWLPEGLPPIRIHVEDKDTGIRLSVTDSIIGKPYAILTDDVTGKTISLSLYQRVFFTGAVDDTYKSPDPEEPIVYVAFGVGTNITLVRESTFEKRTNTTEQVKIPWDDDSGQPPYMGKEWSASPWDSNRLLNLNPEYLVAEKYDNDRTPWSIINSWYHISRIRDICDFYDLKLEDYANEHNRAKRPIIQLKNTVRLYNWPTRWLCEVDTILDGLPAKYANKLVDNLVDKYGYNITQNKLVLFTGSATIYRMVPVLSGGKYVSSWVATSYVATEGAGAFIVGTHALRYYSFIYKKNKWQPAQNKTMPNQCPLVELFDENGVSYSNETVYMNSRFAGAKVLDFKEGPTFDPILKRNIQLSDIEFDALPDVSDVVLSGPNQLQLYTDVDNVWAYDVDVNEKLTSGINYYKSAGLLSSFWNQRSGLDTTMPEQIIEYAENNDLVFSDEVVTPADGFNNIHVFENDQGDINFYFYLKNYGMIQYTSRRESSRREIVLPIINTGLYTEFKITCHNLTTPFALYENKVVDGYSRPVLLESPVVQNNNITNGIITVSLEKTYVDSELNVHANPISPDNSKFLWTYNNIWRVAITRPIEKFKFITNAFLRDRTLPLYADYDYRIATNSLTPSGFDAIEATDALGKKAMTGDKIIVESPALLSTKKTAPYALTSNPGNELLSTVDYYSMYQHLTFEQSTAPNAREFLDPSSTNKFELNVQLGSGTIHKHNQPIGLFGLLASNTELDLIDTITRQAKHYDTFMSKFRSELVQVINKSSDISGNNYQHMLALALDSIYVNQTENTFWHHSNMIGWGFDYKEAVINLTSTGYSFAYPIEPISHEAGKELITHVLCDGLQLQRGVDYKYTSNIDGYHTGIEFANAFTGRQIIIRQWPGSFSSRIPASLAKLGLAPAYMPEIYKDSTYTADTYFIIRHDGTRYYLEDGVNENNLPNNLVDAVMYEYEKMVFSSLSYAIEQLDHSQFLQKTPGYFRQTKQSLADVLNYKNSSLISWQIDNSIFVLDNTTYDAGNGFTYRYQLPDAGVAGSWRAVYKYFYDTDRPHTHPWEMFGYSLKPAGWDEQYSWTDVEKRTNLINALLTGKRGTKQFAFLSRYEEDVENIFPVTLDGELLAPINVAWLADKISNIDFDTDFAAGELGPQEFVFKSTQKGLASEVTATYLLNPLKFVNELWRPGSVSVNAFGLKTSAQTNNSWFAGAIDSSYHRSVDDCFTSGLEALLSEHYILQNKDFYQDIVVKSNNQQIVKEILLSGFTNKNNVRLQSTSINSQRSALYIPEENYAVRTIKHYVDNEFFYSGLRLIWTGKGWMIYGFVTEKPYFSAYVPNPTSLVSSFTAGTFVYKDKQSYNKTVVTYPYGYVFTNKQELYDFIKGYGFYLEDRGFIFDHVETNDLKNWQLSAKQFAFWAADPLLAGNYIDLNPAADAIKINVGAGQLDNLTGSNHLPGFCVSRNNKPLFSKDLVVTRGTITEIKTKDEANPIYGVKFTTSIYESVIHLDKTSIFNDVYFLPAQRLTKRRFLVTGKKTTAWTGRLYAPGYYFYNNDLYVNIDNIADQGRNLLSIEDTTLDKTLIEAAKSQFGLDKNPELRELFLTEESELLFKNTIPFVKGTKNVFTSLEPLTHSNNSYTVPYEEYLVKMGDFGNTKNIQYYEFQLRAKDYNSKKQIINFNLDSLYTDSQVHNVSKNEWVSKPDLSTTLEFTTVGRQSKIETTGPIAKGDTNYSVQTVDDIDLLYNEFKPLWSIPNFDSTVSYPAGSLVRIADPTMSASIRGKVYVFKSSQGPKALSLQLDYMQPVSEPYLPNFFVNTYTMKNPQLSGSGKTAYPPATWQVLQVMDKNLVVKECCPGPDDDSKCLIETLTNHYMKTGDKVLIVNTEEDWGSVNGIWTVEYVSDTSFYIPTRITSKIVHGKLFAFKPVRFEKSADFNLALQGLYGYSWKNKLATIETSLGLSTLNGLPKTLTGYSKVKPLAVVDQAVTSTETATSWDTGGYASYNVSTSSSGVVTTTLIKQEELPVIAGDIEHVIIYDHATKQTVAKIELFDPARLVLPKVFLDEVDSIVRVDPARYNRTSSQFKAVYGSTAWYEDKVGKRWWDTSAVKFTDYKIGNAIERSYKWGLMTDGSSVDVYEWTKSPVHPAQWSDLVNAATEIDGNIASGSVYTEIINGAPVYSWTEEEDYVNGKTVKVYYFWVKNKGSINLNSNRKLSTLQVAKSILNPSAAGIPWCTPLTKDTMLIVGIEHLLTDTTVVQVKRKIAGANKHQQWLFVADYNSAQTIPEYLHIRLRDSVASAIFDINYYGAPYNKLMYLERQVPDKRLHPFNRQGNQVRPYAQSWFVDLYEARRTLIKEVNLMLKNIDLVNSVAGWNNHLNEAVSIGEENVDVTEWWSYVDYVSTTFDYSKYISVVVDSDLQAAIESRSLLAGSYIKVVNPLLLTEVVYEVLDDNGIIPVWRKNGTIAFTEISKATYYKRTWDGAPWDYYPWDDNLSLIFYCIMEALRRDIFVVEHQHYYNKLMCIMFRQVLSEQFYVDWLTKASTIQPYNLLGADLEQKVELERDSTGTLINYFKNVKSYRDKLRDSVILKSLQEPLNGELTDSNIKHITLHYDRHNLGDEPDLLNIKGLDFVDVGWDDEDVPWDESWWDPSASANDVLLQKIYKGLSGIPAEMLAEEISGVTYGRYNSKVNQGQELVNCHLGETSLIVDVEHYFDSIDKIVNVRAFYNNMAVCYVMMMEDKAARLSADITNDTTVISLTAEDLAKLPEATIDSPGAVWIDNERILYFVKTETGITKLIRGSAGTSVVNHIAGAMIYPETNETVLPFNKNFGRPYTTGPFFSTRNRSLDDSDNAVSVILKNNAR